MTKPFQNPYTNQNNDARSDFMHQPFNNIQQRIGAVARPVLAIGALLIVATSIFRVSAVHAQENAGWYVKPAVGVSQLSSQTATASNAGDFTGDWDVDTSTGFTAGLGLGYQYNDKLSAEIYWEYRTNDTDTTLTNGDVFEGNYASNLFYVNGYYHFSRSDNWNNYFGAGVGWTQEIDIDLEQAGVERSFSGDGDIAFQIMLGTDYKLSENLKINAEVRYSAMSSIDMEGEENVTGDLTGLDYNPLTLGVGIKYSF